MGVTIHYSGRLPDMSRLPQLTAAIRDAARQRDWPYQLVDERILGTAEILVIRPLGPPQIVQMDDGAEIEIEDIGADYQSYPVDDRWRGVIVMPPDSEPLWLTFGRDGTLISYQASAESYRQPGNYLAVTDLYTKTQYAGVQVHIGVCELLLLSRGYGVELEVLDEGGYWETGDRVLLERKLGFLDSAIRQVGEQVGARMTGEAGSEATPEIEIGKQLSQPLPDWRRDWGVSANEN